MRRLIVVLYLSSIAAASVPPLPDAAAWSKVPPDVDPARLEAPIPGVPVATGKLLDMRGRGVAGMVAAVLWPSEAMNREIHVGDSVPTPTVGWTRTGADGSYTIEIDPALVPSSYIEPDGRINLDYVGWTDDSIGRSGAPSTLASSSLAALKSADAARGSAPLTLDIVMDLPLTGFRTTDGSQAVAAGDAVAASTTVCTWNLRSEYDVNTIIGRAWTHGSDRGWMYTASSHGMTVGFATSTSGAYGTWTARGTTSASSGVTFEHAESTTDRDFRVAQRYGRYQLMDCAGVWQNNWQSRYRFAIGTFTTGGPGTKPSFPSNNCYPNAAGIWTRHLSDGKAFTMSTGVKSAAALGIDLSVEVSYSSTHVLKYRLLSAGLLCGSNDVPARASEVQTSR
jgi:hypothetical protein